MMFNKGDTVWHAVSGRRQEQEPCPVCFGKLVVHIILGDESIVESPCDYCGRGCEGPRGTVETWKHEATAERLVIEGREITDTDGKINIVYRFNVHSNSWNTARPADLFDNEADALAEAKRRKTEYDKEAFELFLRRRSSGERDRTYSWGIGYHRRCAKRDRASAEYHEAAAKVCMERARPKKHGGPR